MSTQVSTKIPSPIHSQAVRNRAHVSLTLASDSKSPKHIQVSPGRISGAFKSPSDSPITTISERTATPVTHSADSCFTQEMIVATCATTDEYRDKETDKTSPSENSWLEQARTQFDGEQLTKMLLTVSLLKSENKSLQYKLETMTERTLQLEKDVTRGEETIRQLRLSHHEELCRVKKEVGTELLCEKEKLLDQIRQLTTLKCTAETEVSSLKESLLASEERVKGLKKASDNAYVSGCQYENQVKTLKEELLTVRKMDEESERSRESLTKTKQELEDKLDQLSIKHKLLSEKFDNERACHNDQEVSLTERLKVADLRITQLEEEKTIIALEVDKKVIAACATLELNHRDTVHTLKKDVQNAEATICIQEQQILKLQRDLNSGAKINRRGKELLQGREMQSRIPVRIGVPKTPLGKEQQGTSSGKLADISCQSSSSPVSTDSMLSSSVPYYGGRWTADRADFRKHAEEMVLITGALEKEGYGPSQSTVDEVIRHLWWKKERVLKELQSTKNSLCKVIGEDQYKHLQEWRNSVEKMEQELRETKEKHEKSESQAQASRQLLEEKLTSLLQNHHQGTERNHSLRQKQQVLSKENEELRTKLKDLRGKLMDKATTVAQLEAEAASYKSEASATHHELSLQQQRGQVLQTKVECISTELATQKQELAELSMSNGSAVEKLTEAEENAQYYRNETVSLKAKVGELEGELGIRSQELDHTKSERDSLWKQLESLNSQLVTVESQLSREKTNSSNFQSLMEELEGALSRKDDELQLAISQQSELSVQLMTFRNELQVAQEKKASLDVEVNSQKGEILCCKDDLGKATSKCAQLEAELESKSNELSHSLEISKSLQTSVTNLQQDIDVAYKGLDVEKAANRQLKTTVDLLNGNVKRLNQRLEGVDSENAQLKKELTQKKQETFASHEETRSLRMELKEAHTKHSHLARDFEGLQKECRAQAKELSQTKDTLFGLRQKLTVANQDLNASKHEFGDVNAQLVATNAENVQLMKASKVHEGEMQDLKTKLGSALKQSSDKQHLLQEKEEEIKALKKNKSTLRAELFELTNNHESVLASKTKMDDEVKSLSAGLGNTKQQLIEAHRFLDAKCEELDGVHSQVEKLENALSCESEKCATLSMELTSREADLQFSRDRNTKLETDLFQLKGKHLEKTETADHTIMNLQQQVQLVNSQLSSLQSQFTETMEQKEKVESVLKVMTVEKNEVKSKLALVSADLVSTKEVKAALERKVSLVEHELKTFRLDTDDKMAGQEVEMSEMKAALLVSQSQLKHTSEELQMFRDHLDDERTKAIATSKQLEASEDTVTSLKEQLHCLKGELRDEKVQVESLTGQMMDSHSKNEELSQQLYSVKQETYAQQELLQDSEAKFSKCMTSMKQSHEEEKRRLQDVNASLIEDLSHTRDHVSVVEKQLEACESELTETTSKMTHLEQKCARLEAELHSQTNVQETIEDHCSQLKTEHTDARIQIGELNERLSEQSVTVEQLKVELHSSTLECDSLRGQLQLQRETAASSLGRIQRHHEEMCKGLHAKIQELSNKLKEADSSVRTLQRDVTILRVDNTDLKECYKQEKEKCTTLSENLKEETTQSQVCQHRAEQLEISVEIERSAKAHLQECLTEECSLRIDFEATTADLKKQLTSSTNELSQCRTALTKVKSQNEQLKGELKLVQTELHSTKHQVDATRETLKSVTAQSEKDTTSIKQKYHGEKRALKEKVKELKEQVQSLTVRNDSQREEISRLSVANHSINDEQQKTTRKLTEIEHMLQSKKDECKDLQIKNHTLDMQVSQLQQEVSTLCKVQYEFEEQRKRNEARSRNQMQHILSEVTEHMEQQHTAHRYLEKLRTENETIALKERDRTIGQLKNELKMKKQECKKDLLHIDQLELESRYHKSQQRDQEASRRKLEARLEQVNNTLSHTLPLSKTSYRSTPPLYSSTPTSSRYHSASRTHSNL